MQTTKNIEYIQPSGLLAMDILSIEISELREFVLIAFKDDTKLLNNYSSYSTMKELIDTNVQNTIELSKTKEIKCYGIFLEQTVIGFTVIADNLLYSFGINKYCRDKNVKAVWLNWLKRVFNNNFIVVLYKVNTRAINFFLENGFEGFSEDGNVIYLITSKT